MSGEEAADEAAEEEEGGEEEEASEEEEREDLRGGVDFFSRLDVPSSVSSFVVALSARDLLLLSSFPSFSLSLSLSLSLSFFLFFLMEGESMVLWCVADSML